MHRVDSRADLTRRQFVRGTTMTTLGLLTGCARLAAPSPAPGPRVHRVGWLVAAGVPSDEIPHALREWGYVQGHNIHFEFRSAEGQDDRLPALAAELVSLPVDLLLVVGDPPTQAARQATGTIPIVMAQAGNPVATGLVASLARPGGNVTGVTNANQQLVGKRLELLREVHPTLGRVGVLWRAGNTGAELGWNAAQEAARTLGLEVISLELRGPEDFDSAFTTATRSNVEALFTVVDQLIHRNPQRIVDFAAREGLLGMYHSGSFTDAGGLMYYGANTAALNRRVAAQVDRILKGARPADLPVEQPREFDFVLNLKAAQSLGLAFPPHVLLQATELIQ
jgi:putative tryptophan/tyrosine transport system substrate-binding protein